MAFHLLVRDKQGARELADTLQSAVEKVQHCEVCRNLSESNICEYCSDPSRDESLLCIVESPADVLLVEQATGFKGKYFVLMGKLSPLDGIGPEELGLEKLSAILDNGLIKEIIIATNPTVEGEATSHYISEMALKRNIKATRLAHGVPLGGELEYVDNNTLFQAFSDRKEVL
jgi:recombination protein RecR